MGDVATAIAHVLNDANLAEGRIFRPRLPEDQSEHMPRACVIVRRSGGGQLQNGYMPTVAFRVDIRAYGESALEAINLDGQIARLLHHLRATDTPAGRILWCRISGGATDQIDPQTNWPFVLSTWQVYGDWLPAD